MPDGPAAPPPSLAAVVIARDEERHVGACLESVAWATERLVLLDDRTRDQTAELARRHGARVEIRPFDNFSTQRNAALDLATTEWVLFVDADERATPALAREALGRIATADPNAPVGYWIPRRNMIWGGWIRHGGWYPDHQLRLVKRNRARYDPYRHVHELARLAGPEGWLDEPLVHVNYERLGQFFAKQEYYSTLEARRLHASGERARPHNFILQPLREFRRRYVELQGYRDGWRGLVLATLLGYYTLVTYVKLAQLGGIAPSLRST